MVPKIYGVADIVRLTDKARSTVQQAFDAVWPEREFRSVNEQELALWTAAVHSGQGLRRVIKDLYIQNVTRLYPALELFLNVPYCASTIGILLIQDSTKTMVPNLLKTYEWRSKVDSSVLTEAHKILGSLPLPISNHHWMNLMACERSEREKLLELTNPSLEGQAVPQGVVPFRELESLLHDQAINTQPKPEASSDVYLFVDDVLMPMSKGDLRGLLRILSDLKADLDEIVAEPVRLKSQVLTELNQLLALTEIKAVECRRYLLLSLVQAFSTLGF